MDKNEPKIIDQMVLMNESNNLCEFLLRTRELCVVDALLVMEQTKRAFIALQDDWAIQMMKRMEANKND